MRRVKKVFCTAALLGTLAAQVICLASAQQKGSPRTFQFTYRLTYATHTSAGVFDASGALIRTLWSGVSQTAGTYHAVWDGKDDSQKQQNLQSPWTVRVLINNVQYHWDGVIGNTESSWGTSTNIWDGLAYIPTQLRLAFVDDKVWAATGYSEGTANLVYFDASGPNSPTVADARYYNQNISLVDVDADGQFVYVASAAAWGGQNFITKLDAHTGQPVAFTQGAATLFPFAWGNTTLSTIGSTPKGIPPVALAVETHGSLLAVAYADGRVVLFNKTTGASIVVIEHLPQVSSMGFTCAGLWILSGPHVFLITTPGDANHVTEPFHGLSNPVFVATNKANNHVFILDGGTSQQILEYDARGKLVRSFGDKGGFNDMNPSITDTRLLLDNTATSGNFTSTHSWLRVGPANDLWVCDGGNDGRIIHIDAQNHVRSHIEFQQETYVVALGRTVPERLFRGALEYAIDYSVPLQAGDPDKRLGGNGSWKMVRNWSVGAEGAAGSKPANYQVLVGPGGITDVEKLSNGHVYAHVVDSRTKRLDEMELSDDGQSPMRFISTMSVNIGAASLQPDGSLMSLVPNGTPSAGTAAIMRSRLVKFNANGDPVREAMVSIANVAISNEPLPSNGWGMAANVSPTSHGVYPVFATQPYRKGAPHLAGIVPGRATYLWKVLPEAEVGLAHDPSFPSGYGYGGHNGIAAQAVGDNVFASYDGQYALWGNQHFHYWTDGLYIGRFGYSAGWTRGTPMPPGAAGNIAVVRFVTYHDSIYMYMTVEAGYTPVQRWSISQLDSIHEFEGTGDNSCEVKLTLSGYPEEK